MKNQELKINELEANLQAANTRAEHSSSQLREKAAEIVLLETIRVEMEEELCQAHLVVETACTSLSSTRTNVMRLQKRVRRLEHEKMTVKASYERRIHEGKAEHEKGRTELLGFI